MLVVGRIFKDSKNRVHAYGLILEVWWFKARQMMAMVTEDVRSYCVACGIQGKNWNVSMQYGKCISEERLPRWCIRGGDR
ncbi:Uncharacterized protein TCM_028009 [Theobroma cacao]|uniref:Uncharacterized protein n=1 Tax=Theobroma cacao TaxID=3641 RepID=A0A061G959_THECC|nr:Uncharacterized protein TCM_028009 [Theobroma cacao]